MSTIDELMQGKQPGEIRVRHERWEPGAWFRPYYRTKYAWYGPTNSQPSQLVLSDDDDWCVYTEPKPKVKRWLWREKNSGAVYCDTEEEISLDVDHDDWQKIPGTETLWDE